MNRRTFLKQAFAVFGVILVVPSELIAVVETSIDPLCTGQLGVFDGVILHMTDIETARKSLQENEIKPIDINGESYYMLFPSLSIKDNTSMLFMIQLFNFEYSFNPSTEIHENTSTFNHSTLSTQASQYLQL